MTDKPHFLIVEARFYADLLDAMLAGAKCVLDKAGATYEIVTVPGALEIPGAIKFAHRAGNAGRHAPSGPDRRRPQRGARKRRSPGFAIAQEYRGHHAPPG